MADEYDAPSVVCKVGVACSLFKDQHKPQPASAITAEHYKKQTVSSLHGSIPSWFQVYVDSGHECSPVLDIQTVKRSLLSGSVSSDSTEVNVFYVISVSILSISRFKDCLPTPS